ncbi:hypothetical protein FACS189427_09880 [Planctomycetales bacterium]|nr:hypothetical protein FACS189427_09880 [Planctomycetales bacterium]
MPQNFPAKLTPSTVTLLKDGKPIDNAAIVLIAESATPFLVSAMTNSAGIAKPETSINTYSRVGVPAGTYKVLIMKQVNTVSPADEEPDATKRAELEAKARREKTEQQKSGLSPDWNDINKTPFKLTVPENGKSFTIEISDTKTFVQ